MSRSDDQRIADILDAADELAAIIELGRERFLSEPTTPPVSTPTRFGSSLATKFRPS